MQSLDLLRKLGNGSEATTRRSKFRLPSNDLPPLPPRTKEDEKNSSEVAPRDNNNKNLEVIEEKLSNVDKHGQHDKSNVCLDDKEEEEEEENEEEEGWSVSVKIFNSSIDDCLNKGSIRKVDEAEENEEDEEEEEEEKGQQEDDEAVESNNEEVVVQQNGEQQQVEAVVRRQRRRRLLPYDMVYDVLAFLSHNECGRLYTTNYRFTRLLERRRQLCFQLFIKRVDDTRTKLDETIKEIKDRRENISVLTDRIGMLSTRVSDMGRQLSALDSNIASSHKKLDELFERIKKLRAPSPFNKEDDDEEGGEQEVEEEDEEED